jgi:MoaE-MoaD fusion protein
MVDVQMCESVACHTSRIRRLFCMEVTVRLFAGLRERAGRTHLAVDVPEGSTVSDLLAALADTPVGVLPDRSCVVAVNRVYAPGEQVVRAGDEVALIPPVSGGEGPVRRARVTPEELDVAELSRLVRDPRAGAVVVFEGVTREVERLEYEAYAEMAEPRLLAIAAEEAQRHGLCAVAVDHRVGTVALSEPSVIVAASAPHRGEAFAGARAVIDRVKAEAPIWKKEEERWVEGALPPPDADPRAY